MFKRKRGKFCHFNLLNETSMYSFMITIPKTLRLLVDLLNLVSVKNFCKGT